MQSLERLKVDGETPPRRLLDHVVGAPEIVLGERVGQSNEGERAPVWSRSRRWEQGRRLLSFDRHALSISRCFGSGPRALRTLRRVAGRVRGALYDGARRRRRRGPRAARVRASGRGRAARADCWLIPGRPASPLQLSPTPDLPFVALLPFPPFLAFPSIPPDLPWPTLLPLHLSLPLPSPVFPPIHAHTAESVIPRPLRSMPDIPRAVGRHR